MITESGASSSLWYPNIKDGFGQTASTINCTKKGAIYTSLHLAEIEPLHDLQQKLQK